MASDQIIIRSPETPAEWAEVKRLLMEYHREFDDDTCFSSFEEEMTHIEDLYSSPKAKKLIAVDKETGQIVGCVAYRTWSPGTAEMKRLYVVPAYRKNALGRRLVLSIVDECIKAGFKSMVLDTMVRMHAAQQLYRSMGFEEIPPYHGQDREKVICFKKYFRAYDERYT